jgi:glycosyltransferase involved in cell wall biosynthesis
VARPPDCARRDAGRATREPDEQLRVCVVGAGTRFLSGISYYTLHLTNALARSHRVSVVLMRQLLPTSLYPGRQRVGAQLTCLGYPPTVPVFDGVDWYWLPSLCGALRFLIHQRPRVVIFQWWSGTVLHSYAVLAMAAHLRGAQVVVEFHEVLDPGESRLPLARTYARILGPWLLRLASAFVVHSEYDRAVLARRYSIRKRAVAVIPHGPYDQLRSVGRARPLRFAPGSTCNLLFFGVIRPFKGLEDLVATFDAIPPAEIGGYWLTVVGETWEGWTQPAERIARSRYGDRITFINRYVTDQEVARLFAGADAVVLPYHRSSASGPLQMAMSWGLPVVVTGVGGLTEAAAGYPGAMLVPPKDHVALLSALRQLPRLAGQRFADPHSWRQTEEHYHRLFTSLTTDARPSPDQAGAGPNLMEGARAG